MTGQTVPSAAFREWQTLTAALRSNTAVPCEVAAPTDAWWSTDPDGVAQARTACEGCPVRGECLAYAIAAEEGDGIWGGLDVEQRRARIGTIKKAAALPSHLRALRRARGLKLHELAATVGITYAYLSNIELGRRPLTRSVLPRLADALEVSCEALAG